MEEHLLNQRECPHEKDVVILQRVRTSLMVQRFRLHLPMRRWQVQSLVGELGSHMPCSKKTKQKQYFNKCGESESPANSLQPYGLYGPWNSPGQNTGVGSLSLLQGIFPTQGSNPGLLHCRQILYQLSHQGSPRILEW